MALCPACDPFISPPCDNDIRSTARHCPHCVHPSVLTAQPTMDMQHPVLPGGARMNFDLRDAALWCQWRRHLMNVTWTFDECDAALWYVWRRSLIYMYVKRTFDIGDAFIWCMWRRLFICVTPTLDLWRHRRRDHAGTMWQWGVTCFGSSGTK
jgi:hypothetical protein